jgi:hypothetical protein
VGHISLSENIRHGAVTMMNAAVYKPLSGRVHLRTAFRALYRVANSRQILLVSFEMTANVLWLSVVRTGPRS